LIGYRRRTARAAVLACALAGIGSATLLPSSASATVVCALSGTHLSVTAATEEAISVRRDEGRIKVEELIPDAAHESYTPVERSCGGGPATPTNTDSIAIDGPPRSQHVFVVWAFDGLAPGATPEPDGTSEIETTIGGNAQFSDLVLGGSPGPQNITAGQVGPAAGFNMNAGVESSPDVDLTVVPSNESTPTLTLSPFADVFTANGGPGFGGPLAHVFDVDLGAGDDLAIGGARRLFMRGEAGNDLMLGGAGNDSFSGGAGRDRLFGFAGKDDIGGEGGRDVMSGGPGRDRIRGGPGGDRINCGPGRDDLITYLGERGKSCEFRGSLADSFK
jgi:hypothetical protein